MHTVKFNDKMIARLLGQQVADSARNFLLRLNEAGMRVQGEPRPGRVNVTYPGPDGRPVYRTFSRRDLTVVTA